MYNAHYTCRTLQYTFWHSAYNYWLTQFDALMFYHKSDIVECAVLLYSYVIWTQTIFHSSLTEETSRTKPNQQNGFHIIEWIFTLILLYTIIIMYVLLVYVYNAAKLIGFIYSWLYFLFNTLIQKDFLYMIFIFNTVRYKKKMWSTYVTKKIRKKNINGKTEK